MDSERLTYLFHRYVHNTCTDAEKAEFLELVSDGGNDDELRRLMGVLWRETSGPHLNSDSTEIILRKILETKETTPQKHRGFAFAARIAASLLLLSLFSAAALLYFSDDRASRKENHHASVDNTQPGYVKLSDGSTVILNGSSQLHFPQVFGDDIREVTLTGEGYFDIAHDTKRPFVVHTGNLKTTVLGTAFNIKAYPDQSDITVTVTRGKVSVSNDRQLFGIVNPDEQITFYKTEAVAQQKGVDSHEATSWMEKDIYFDDVTIAQAVDQLEKRFDARIVLEDPAVGACRFTATFVKGENLSQILRIICDFNNATLQITDAKKFLIRGGSCSTKKRL